ncbi:MAG: DnaJ domain-containing protein [Deltaproteobacteria bacterium]|nr:MAG: DnaJ domain-containing protein [Deltaproteobacteria bacterium]
MQEKDLVIGSETLKYRPRINQSLDLRKLSIDPKEGFLLSRVDGNTSVEQLLMVSGMDREETMQSLSKLLKQGIIFFAEKLKEKTERKEQGAPYSQVKGKKAEKEEDWVVDEGVEISEKDKEKIHSTYKSLGNLNYYKILGIEKGADQRKIKSAYFSLSREFHPDRYFRKSIGRYKSMLENIFKKVSEAYEILYDPHSREEYDKSIISDISEEKIIEARKQSEKPIRKGHHLDKALQPIIERMGKAKGFYKTGKKDVLDKNYKSASVNFKLAVAYDPYNEQYKESLAEAQEIVKKQESEKLIRRAAFEEEVGRFADALKLLEQVVQITSDNPEPYHKMAQLLLNHNRDLRQAKNYCLRAIDMDSDNTEYYLTLGSIYEAAGLFRNAAREFQKVLNLDKGNSEAQEGLKRLKKFH